MAEKYCVGEDCVVTIGEQPKALAVVAAIIRAKAGHIVTEIDPTFKSSFKDQVADSEWKATTLTVKYPASFFSQDQDNILIRTVPIEWALQMVLTVILGSNIS